MFAITDSRCAAVITLAVLIFVDMTYRLNDVILVGAAADGAGMLSGHSHSDVHRKKRGTYYNFLFFPIEFDGLLHRRCLPDTNAKRCNRHHIHRL